MTIGSLLYVVILLAVVAIVAMAVLWAIREFGTPEPLAKVLRIAIILVAILVVVIVLLQLAGIGVGTAIIPPAGG